MFSTLRAGILVVSLATICESLSGFAQTWNGRESGTLSSKYDGRNVMRGSSEVLRLDATTATLPVFPTSLSKAQSQGLVIVELAVAPEGRVKELLILESFAAEASAAVRTAVQDWRFRHVKDLTPQGTCGDCIRISRLGFQFVISDGKARVLDLAYEEIKRRNWPDPVTGKRPWLEHK